MPFKKTSKLILFLFYGCKKEPLDTNPLVGEWELLAIENNLGGVVMETPYSKPQTSVFKNDGYYKIDLHWGSCKVYKDNRCEFFYEGTFAVGLEGDYLKWSEKLSRLHKRMYR